MSVNGEGGGDDVNKVQSGDFGVSELARIGEQYKRVPYSQRAQKRRLKEAQYTVNGEGDYAEHEATYNHAQTLLKATKDPDTRKEIKAIIKNSMETMREIEHAQNTITRLKPRLREYKESTRERLNNQAMNVVGRNLSETSVNSYVSSTINGQTTQTSGLGLSAQNSFEDLAARREGILSQIGDIRGQSVEMAGSYIGRKGVNPDVNASLQQNAEKVRSLASELGPIAVAMKMQKSLGQDPESRHRRMLGMNEKAQDYLNFEKLRTDISQGEGEYGGLSAKDIKKKETEAAQNLVKAFDELRRSAGKSKEEIAKLSKKAEEAADKFEEVQDAMAAGAGGGGSNPFGAPAAAASTMSNLAHLVGNYFQVLGINQPMAQMSNAGGFANIENQKHDSWRAALGGNMTERLNLAGWANAHAFGKNRAEVANWKVDADIVGGGLGVVGGGLQTAEALAAIPGQESAGKIFGFSTGVASVGQGLQAVGESGLVTASSIIDRMDNISSGSANIAGVNLTMDTIRKLNHIPGYQLQQYRDHIAGLYGASNYMGGKGNDFLDQTAGGGFLGMMQQVGLGSQEAGSLSMFGAQNMGSMFDANQVLSAKRFENLGFGSSEENMRRMMSLSGGSTQNPSESLEHVLERAVAMGLNSSKALTTIADNTGAMAEQTAMKGMTDVGDQINRLIMAGMDRGNPNQEFAAKQAVSAYQTGEQARNNRSASWLGMVAVSRLQSTLGVKWEDAYALQGLSVAELRKMEGQKPNEIRESLFRRGVDTSGTAFSDENMTKSLQDIIQGKVMSQSEANGGFAYGANQAWSNVIKPWLDGGKGRAGQLVNGKADSLPQDVREALLPINRVAGNMGMDSQAYLRDLLAAGGYRDVGLGGLGSGVLGDIPGSRGQLAQEMSRKAVQDAKAAQKGLGVLTDGSNTGRAGIAAVNATGAVTQAMAGPDAETTWAEAAAKSAKDFGESAVKLNAASGKLERAAAHLMTIAGVSGLAGTKADKEKMNQLPDAVKAGQKKLEELAGSHH